MVTRAPTLTRAAARPQAFTEENFRGIRLWAQIHRELRAARVKTVSPEATAAAVASRRDPGPLDALLGPPPVLLDVREEVYHRKARPDGSVNVPLYKQLVCVRMTTIDAAIPQTGFALACSSLRRLRAD